MKLPVAASCKLRLPDVKLVGLVLTRRTLLVCPTPTPLVINSTTPPCESRLRVANNEGMVPAPSPPPGTAFA